MSYPPRPGTASNKTLGGGNFAQYIHVWAEGKKGSLITPTGNKGFQGRILPSFDFNYQPEDDAFKTAWAPYRYEADPDAGEDDHPPFSHWYFPFYIHAYYGPNKRTFFSPKSKRRLGISSSREESFDPIDSINFYVHKSTDWEEWKAKRTGTMQVPALIPMPQDISLMNVYGSYAEKDPANHLLYLKTAGMEHLLEILNNFPHPKKGPLDKDWPEYMFGDVTNAKTGLWCWSSQCIMDTGKQANTLAFTKNDASHEGARVMAVNKEALANRINFYDTVNSIHISTPQEIIDYLVDDGKIPLELMKEACGEYVDIPEGPKKKKTQVVSDEDDTPPPARRSQPQQDKPRGHSRPSNMPASGFTPEPEDDDDDIPFTFPNKKEGVKTDYKVVDEEEDDTPPAKGKSSTKEESSVTDEETYRQVMAMLDKQKANAMEE